MTRLQKFKESARGIALGAVLFGIMAPGLQERIWDYPPTGHTDQTASSQTNAPYYDERKGYVSSDIIRYTKAVRKHAVLTALHEEVAAKNERLFAAVNSFVDLHRELSMMIENFDDRISGHDQVRLLAETSLDWLRVFKQEQSSDISAADAEADAPKAALVSGDGILNPVFAEKDFGTQAGYREDENLFLGALVEEFLEDNGEMEVLLAGISADLDTIVRAAAEPEEDVEAAILAFQSYTNLVEEYLRKSNPDAEYSTEDARQKDEIGQLIDEYESAEAHLGEP